MKCSSLVSCFRSHFDYGFVHPPIFYDSGPVPEEAIFFNFIYIITINLIVTAILSGIIIDTFADMRNDKAKI